MSITIEWMDSEKTLLLWTTQDPWTWEDLDKAYRELCHSISSVSHCVDVLIDARGHEAIPKNMLSMIATRYTIYPANMKSVVVIGARSIIAAVVAVMHNLHPTTFSRIRFAKNFDEAYQWVGAKARNRC